MGENKKKQKTHKLRTYVCVCARSQIISIVPKQNLKWKI